MSLSPGEPIEREALSRLFWPQRFEPQARASLRQCLHELNRQLEAAGLNVLDISPHRVAVRREAIRTDLGAIEAALAQRDHDTAVRLLKDTSGVRLLDDIRFGKLLEDWLNVRRTRIESRLQVAADQLVKGLNAAGDASAVGQLKAAMRRRAGDVDWRSRLGIAVLPFEQVDEVGGAFFLAEGVVDELSSRLGRVSGISIVGQTSVNSLVHRGLTLPEIASALNVTHLIEGTVRRTTTAARVTIRLIDGPSGREIWSDRLEGAEADFLGARQVFSDQVVASLGRVLGVDMTSPPTRRMTVNREAYALYLQGRALVQRSMTDGAPAKARELLQDALTLDPEFADCWTALAEAHVHTAVYTPCLERVTQSRLASECAQRAVDLDPGQGHARAMLGIHEWTCHNPSGALDHAFEAYRLEPNNADVTVRLGSFLLYIGRTGEALPYIEAAVAQDPVYGRNYAMLCTAHFNLGNYAEAEAAGQRMVDLGMPGLHLAVVKATAGDRAGALEAYYRTRLLMGSVVIAPPGTAPMNDEARDFYWTTAAAGVCSGEDEARATYCQMLDMLHSAMADPYDPSIAWPAIWMGHCDLVMKLYRACIHPANMPGLMSLWADVEPIRQVRLHPGFMSFAEDIGLVAAWEKYGWPDLMPSDPRLP